MVIVIKHRRCLADVVPAALMVIAISISIVLMLVVSQMLRLTLVTFVQAVRLHRRPDGLERQQYKQKDGDQSTHGSQYIGRLLKM